MKTLAKRITVLLLTLAFLASLATNCFTASATEITAEDAVVSNVGATQNQLNIKARAEYMYGLTWVAQANVSIHSYSWYDTFYAGNTYHLPYGQGSVSNYIGYGVSPETFIRDAANANSVFYTKKCYAYDWYSTYYIQDCSGFVSWCWGLTAKQSTRSLANYSSYVASVTTNNIINYIQLGDALNRYDYHVVLVTDLIYTNGTLTGIEITEQTFPDTEKHVYTPSQLASTYSSYDGIYRYYGTVPASPGGVTKNHKLDGQDPVDMGKDFYARIANESIGKYFTDKDGEVWAEGLSGDANQVWHFMRQSNGEYLIGNSSTAKFLQVKDGVYKDGTRLVTGSMDYEDHQKFYVFYMYNNFYLMPAGADMTVDIDCSLFHTQICGTSTQNGVHEASFKARSLNIEVVSVYDGTRETSELGDSFVAEIKNVASGKYVTADGASLIGADKNGLDTQKWTFTRLPSGCYTIVSKSENLAIDVAHTLLAEGTPVDMYDLTNLNAQRFFLIKKDGSYYLKPTYTVNTLHYNSADNQFYTYATADDSAKLAAQKFELIIEGGAESELVLKDTSALSKDGTELNKVAIGQTASTILSNFENKEAVVKDAAGNDVSSTANVGTGYTVDLVVNGEKVDSVTVIILGEVTGDGLLNATDYLKIKSSLNGGEGLTGAYEKAADVDGNNELNGTDYMRVKAHFLGNYNLYK